MYPLSKYKPSTVKAVPWNEIRSHYVQLVNHGWLYEEMIGLIDFITTGELGARLYAYTSIDKLVLSIYENITPAQEVLSIYFDRGAGMWNFQYQPEQFAKAEHERQYKDDLIGHFQNYITLLKW